jgi:hypothetical protein
MLVDKRKRNKFRGQLSWTDNSHRKYLLLSYKTLSWNFFAGLRD